MPGIDKHSAVHDIAGLMAPRPLLIELGVQDTGFPIEDQLEGFEALKKIQAAAGAAEDLWAEVHPGEHMFANNKAKEFFANYL